MTMHCTNCNKYKVVISVCLFVCLYVRSTDQVDIDEGLTELTSTRRLTSLKVPQRSCKISQ